MIAQYKHTPFRCACLVVVQRKLSALRCPCATNSTSVSTMANMNNSPITQVSQNGPTHTNLQPQLLTRLFLDLRGRRFEVDRETIMNLPESVLLCLFPNGLVLSRQSVALSDGGGDDEDEEVYGVDVRDCYVIHWMAAGD